MSTTLAARIRSTATCRGVSLGDAPENVGELRESNDIMNSAEKLRSRMQEDGYLLLRGLLDRDDVLDARREVMRRLAIMEPLDSGRVLMDVMNELAADNPPLAKVLYDGPMMRFFDVLLGEPAKHFDFTWFRSVRPGDKGAAPHTDVIFMGREERDRLFTAWTPIGNVDLEQGGLVVLEGSNNHPGLRDGYSRTDVDSYCSNREDSRDWWNRRIEKAEEGQIADDASQVRRILGGRWLTTEYIAGDVLVFSVFTVHGSLDNHSDRIRLSSDSRYQPASKPADSRWIGANPIGHGPEAKRALIC